MKTNFSKKNISIYSIVGLAVFAFSSCGSYQNSSYYDRDGIYNSADGQNREGQNSNSQNSNSNQYKDYFGSLQNDKVEIFTDVENYDSTSDAPANQGYNSGYAGWGNDSENVTVNVYGNNLGYGYWNYWYGPNLAWSSWYGGPYWNIGWNSWYGPSWGWGWNNYYAPYYGYNNYYGNNWCNYNYGNNYAYHGGRRGAYYSQGIRNENSTRFTPTRRSYTQNNSGNVRNTHSGVRAGGTRTYSTTGNIRNQSNGTRGNNNTYSPSNNNIRQSSSPTRSYSPSPSSSGGTRSSGSYGGGGSRSGGGGGGRR